MYQDDDFSVPSSSLSHDVQPRGFQEPKQFRIVLFCILDVFSQPMFVRGSCRKGEDHDEMHVRVHDGMVKFDHIRLGSEHHAKAIRVR